MANSIQPDRHWPGMITPWDLIARLQEQVDDLARRVAALESSPRERENR